MAHHRQYLFSILALTGLCLGFSGYCQAAFAAESPPSAKSATRNDTQKTAVEAADEATKTAENANAESAGMDLATAQKILDNPDSAASAGDLLVAPTRIVFSGRTRSAEVILKNRGNQPRSFRLDLVDIALEDNGKSQHVENYERSAKAYIRFSPRQVSLEPGAMQKVKLLLRKPSDLAAGEYRTHLKVQTLPDASAASNVEAPPEGDGISITLTPLIGLTIPVLAQHGELNASLDLKATRSDNSLDLTMKRGGSRSVLGDVTVKQHGQIIASSQAAVLFPLTTRQLTLALPENTPSAPLTVEFTESGEKDAAPLASITL